MNRTGKKALRLREGRKGTRAPGSASLLLALRSRPLWPFGRRIWQCGRGDCGRLRWTCQWRLHPELRKGRSLRLRAGRQTNKGRRDWPAGRQCVSTVGAPGRGLPRATWRLLAGSVRLGRRRWGYAHVRERRRAWWLVWQRPQAALGTQAECPNAHPGAGWRRLQHRGGRACRRGCRFWLVDLRNRRPRRLRVGSRRLAETRSHRWLHGVGS